jgi:peptidoglycan/LPS O-acetylase OafA/YrhL
MLAGGLAAVVGPWGFVAFSLVLASGAALVVHRLFERPLTAWTRRRLEGTGASLPDRGAVDYADVGAGSPAPPDTDTRASP